MYMRAGKHQSATPQTFFLKSAPTLIGIHKVGGATLVLDRQSLAQMESKGGQEVTDDSQPSDSSCAQDEPSTSATDDCVGGGNRRRTADMVAAATLRNRITDLKESKSVGGGMARACSPPMVASISTSGATSIITTNEDSGTNSITGLDSVIEISTVSVEDRGDSVALSNVASSLGGASRSTQPASPQQMSKNVTGEDGGMCPRVASMLLLLILIAGTGVGIYIVYTYTDEEHNNAIAIDILQFFNVTDGIDVRWAKLRDISVAPLNDQLMSQQPLVQTCKVYSLTVGAGALEVQVLPPGGGKNTGAAVLLLSSLLNMLGNHPAVGIKLVFNDPVSLASTLTILRFYSATGRLSRRPIWLHFDYAIIRRGYHFNLRSLTDHVKNEFPEGTLSVGETTSCSNNTIYTPFAVEQLWSDLRRVELTVSFSVCLDNLHTVWPLLQWLLSKKPGRFHLNVIGDLPKLENDRQHAYHGLLLVRNDLGRGRVFFELPTEVLSNFMEVTPGASSLTNAFMSPNNDGAFIRWSGSTNKAVALLSELQGNDMLVGDVVAGPNGSLLMGRTTQDVGQLSFGQWLSAARDAHLGVKLHVGRDNTVAPVIRILKKAIGSGANMYFRFRKPLWVSANVFEAPASSDPILDRRAFQLAMKELPYVTVCLGWTKSRRAVPYSAGMLRRMTDYAAGFAQPVVFAVRAGAARASWSELMTALEKSRGFKLLVETDSVDEVTLDDLLYVHAHSEVHRIYYRLPRTIMEAFHQQLEAA